MDVKKELKLEKKVSVGRISEKMNNDKKKQFITYTMKGQGWFKSTALRIIEM